MTDLPLRIIAWNANGLLLRVQELEMFLHYMNIDLALISETHFTNKTYLKIPGFTIYETPHPNGRAHGGSAVIIRSN